VRWLRRRRYYRQGNNQERLAQCFYHLEDYAALEELAHTLPESSPLLPQLATMFTTVGLCKQAVLAYSKCGMIKESINVCVSA